MSTSQPQASPLGTATELARAAGDLLYSYYGSLRRGDAERKGGQPRDLVTRADREAERLVYEGIPAADDVLAEEGSARHSGARRRWIVDPLDGTVNYLHGIPFWAVSIAIVEDDRLAAAVVHAPALRQTFTAEAGRGCRLDDAEARVSSTAEIGEALLATGFAYNRDAVDDTNLGNFAVLAMAAAGVRRLGAASLDLAYTACGRLDGFWELHLQPWDVAAGTLLVREAGGTVTDFRGNEGVEPVLFAGNIVATNGHLHEALRGRLRRLEGTP